MSTVTASFHRVVSAAAKTFHVKESNWLELTFAAEDGSTFQLVIFSDTPEMPESLLASLAPAKVAEAAS